MTDAPIDHLRQDPTIGPLVERHGPVTLEPAEDFFERMVDSIVSQQLATGAAKAIRKRLHEAVEITPTSLAAVDDETLRAAGLSRQKSAYIKNLAAATAENGYSHEYFEGMDDEAVIEELTSITGIGVWTAKMQLLFNLARPDVFPVEDLGIRRSMEALYGEGITRSEMETIAEDWRPYRSYASLYLWRHRDE